MIKRVFSHYVVILTMALASIYNVATAYEINMQSPVFEDYIPLLEQSGYYVYSFDIKSLTERKFNLLLTCREYEGDSLVSQNISPFSYAFPNMRLVSEYPEDYQQRIKPEEMYDSVRGIHMCAEKIVIGTYPMNDSITMMMVDIKNMSTMSIPLKLRALKSSLTGKKVYSYRPRPFKVGELPLDTFIPLMFYGSAWQDGDLIRFCGANELDPDMSDGLVKDVPHSYVIGVTVTNE